MSPHGFQCTVEFGRRSDSMQEGHTALLSVEHGPTADADPAAGGESPSPLLPATPLVEESKTEARLVATSAQRANLRWLAVVFLSTLFILIFQVIVGLYCKSLVLIADSAHSGTDVITYALNYVIERLKISAQAGGHSWPGSKNSTSTAVWVDLVGGGLSTAALVAATWFAMVEALSRLQAAPPPKEDAEFGSIGPALLSFAILSTAANVGTLVLYVRWQSDSTSTRFLTRLPVALPDLSEDLEMMQVPESMSMPAVSSSASQLPPPEAAQPMPLQAGPDGQEREALTEAPPLPALDQWLPVPRGSSKSSKRSPRRAPRTLGNAGLDSRGRGSTGASGGGADNDSAADAGANGRLNLCGDFAGGPDRCADCQTGLCSEETSAGSTADGESLGGVASNKCYASGCGQCNGEAGAKRWSSVLHMLVHPGCSDAAHTGADLNGSCADASSAEVNFNVTSAMLHLVADVLRGLTILVVAVIIQMGYVRDPGKADAVCALLVAVFVLLGALAIFKRLGSALWRSGCGRKRTPPARE